MKSSGNLLFTQMRISVFVHLVTSPDKTTSTTSDPAAPIPIAIPMVMARPTLYTCNMQHRSTGKCNGNFTAIGLNKKSIFKMKS